MAALKHLVEGECGGSNPLTQWSSNVIQGQPSTTGVFNRDRLNELTEDNELVREFLQGEAGGRPMVPQTFNMSSLLQEIPQVSSPHERVHPNKRDVLVDSWIEEFGNRSSPNQQRHQLSNTTATRAEQQWVNEFSNDSTHEIPSVKQWIEEFSGNPQDIEAEKWVQEFQSENEDPDLMKVARDISSSVQDPKIQESEFMKFINKLGNGEVKLEDTNENTTDWDKEFLAAEGKTYEEDFWANLEDAWSDVNMQHHHPWLKDYEQNKEYKFFEDNPMKSIENPFDKGLEKLRNGDLPSAVLLFEAHVQQNTDSVEGWKYLGISQAHNEQDMAAVAAFEKCLSLDPINLPALQGLAVSYTNESLQSKACQSLRKWLKLNPKYSSLVPDIPEAPSKPFMPSFMSKEEHKEVTDLFLQAARQSVKDIDPDVQIGLGVLFNLSCEYDKAVDCFSAALQVRPDDPMLWNKLGATQANSNRSEEAINAYRRALELASGLTRSRYNLGISCINLRAYREAVEHFLMALNLQCNADTPQGMQSLMSEGIWSTLRLAIMYHERPDLIPLVDSRNLEQLLTEFGL